MAIVARNLGSSFFATETTEQTELPLKTRPFNGRGGTLEEQSRSRRSESAGAGAGAGAGGGHTDEKISNMRLETEQLLLLLLLLLFLSNFPTLSAAARPPAQLSCSRSR